MQMVHIDFELCKIILLYYIPEYFLFTRTKTKEELYCCNGYASYNDVTSCNYGKRFIYQTFITQYIYLKTNMVNCYVRYCKKQQHEFQKYELRWQPTP